MTEQWHMIRSTDELHKRFKLLEESDPDGLADKNIHRCGHCRGTGLKFFTFSSQTDPHTICPNCMGIGYLGFKQLDDDYSTCPDCNASGYQLQYENHVVDCKTCDGSGRLDWVTAVLKGIDMEKIW